jgi:hypothetical protein
MEYICFYVAGGGPKRCFYWGVPNVPKISNVPINMAPYKKPVSAPMN